MRLKGPAVVTALILCSSCSSTADFQPEEGSIAKLEDRLAESHCVGNLDSWQRAYVRKQSLSENEPGKFDRRMIEFTLQRADGKTIVAGRKSMKRYEDWAIVGGCSEPNCLFGGYVIPTDELILDCGGPP
jgi:hypothetical protein